MRWFLYCSLEHFFVQQVREYADSTFYHRISGRLRMMGPYWGQWVTQNHSDYLFHSLIYILLIIIIHFLSVLIIILVNSFTWLYRLTAGDAKWIYDHCALETKVVIYSDRSTYGPWEEQRLTSCLPGIHGSNGSKYVL